MPLVEFVAETMPLLSTDAKEILVERVKQIRSKTGPDDTKFITQFNDLIDSSL